MTSVYNIDNLFISFRYYPKSKQTNERTNERISFMCHNRVAKTQTRTACRRFQDCGKTLTLNKNSDEYWSPGMRIKTIKSKSNLF